MDDHATTMNPPANQPVSDEAALAAVRQVANRPTFQMPGPATHVEQEHRFAGHRTEMLEQITLLLSAGVTLADCATTTLAVVRSDLARAAGHQLPALADQRRSA